MVTRLQVGRPVQVRAAFNGKRLNRLRLERNLSARALADLIGCVNATIFAWEKGRSSPSEDATKLLAKVFGVEAKTFKP